MKHKLLAVLIICSTNNGFKDNENFERKSYAMAENLEQELIEQDELLNAFQVILKNQNTGKTTIRKKPTSLPLKTNLNTKVFKHSSVCDYIKVKKPDVNRARETRSIKIFVASGSSNVYNDGLKTDNKEINEIKGNHSCANKTDHLTVDVDTNDGDSSPSDYLTPATANFYPLGTDANTTTDISPQFDIDMTTNESFGPSVDSTNNNYDAAVESNSVTTSGIDLTDSVCENIKDDVFGSRHGESASKEEKERLNEEIAIQSSSLSSETGSWEPVFPPKSDPEIKQICSIFIRNEQLYSQACNTVLSTKQNVTKSSAFFIDAKSLLDDSEVSVSYGGTTQNIIILNNAMKKSSSKESNNSCDTSNEDSLELEANNAQKQCDSSDTLSIQFPIDDSSGSEQPCILPKTPENSILQVKFVHQSTESPRKKQKYDECMPIISGGATIDDFAPQLSSACKSLPASLDPNINIVQHHKEKFINSWIVNYDNLDSKYNTPSSSTENTEKKIIHETKRPLGFYVDFSKVDSEDESTKESSSYTKGDKKIFSMYVDISDNKTLKEMPSSLSSSLKTRNEVPKPIPDTSKSNTKRRSDTEKSFKNPSENKENKKVNESNEQSTPKKDIGRKHDFHPNCNVTRKETVIKNDNLKSSSSNNTNKANETKTDKTTKEVIKNIDEVKPTISVKERSVCVEVVHVQDQVENEETNYNNKIENKIQTIEQKQIRNPTIQKSVKSSVNRHSWNMNSSSFEGGIQKMLYQTKKSASLSHCNLKELQKGDISKKDSNYSLSDISLGDQSYSRSDDSRNTDETKDQDSDNPLPQIKRKHKSEAKINETFDKSSTCSDRLTLTQDSTPTVTEQEDLTYHPEPNTSTDVLENEESVEIVNDQKFVKLSDLDELPQMDDIDDPIPLMTNSLPIPTQRISKIMFRSLHVENLDKLARLFPELKKEFSRSTPESMTLSLNSDKSTSRHSKNDIKETTTDLTFPSDMEYVFLHEIGADINIIVEKKRIIKANKGILAARCAYFAGVLAPKGITEIEIENFDYSVVHFTLLHIYSGIRAIPTSINIFLLAALADKWGLLDLKDIVSKILYTDVCHSLHTPCGTCLPNILRCLTISETYGMDVLIKSIFTWTLKHFDIIFLTEDFHKLDNLIAERCLRKISSSIRITNLMDIISKCENLKTPAVEMPNIISCYVDHIVNECCDYVSSNLPSVLGDSTMLALLYPPFKNGNLLEDMLFQSTQYTSPEKMCIAVKNSVKLLSLNSPEESPVKKVLCRFLPHLEGSIILKAQSIDRLANTAAWKEMDLTTQERLKYFSRFIKKPTVIMVPPLCKISSQNAGQCEHDQPGSYAARPANRAREPSHIPILARDSECIQLPNPSARSSGQMQQTKNQTHEVKNPNSKTATSLLKVEQTLSGRQSPGDKSLTNKKPAVTNDTRALLEIIHSHGEFNKYLVPDEETLLKRDAYFRDLSEKERMKRILSKKQNVEEKPLSERNKITISADDKQKIITEVKAKQQCSSLLSKNKHTNFSDDKQRASGELINKRGKLNAQNRSHPNLSQKPFRNPKLNTIIDKPVSQIKSFPGSIKQSPPVTLNKISPDTSQSTRSSCSTKCSVHNKFHNINTYKKTETKIMLPKNRQIVQVKKNTCIVKQTSQNKAILAENKSGNQGKKTIPVSSTKYSTQNKPSSKQSFTTNTKCKLPHSSNDVKPNSADKKIKKEPKPNPVEKPNTKAKNAKVNPDAEIVEINDIPIMERSGTFLKEEPTVICPDKSVHLE